MDFWGLMAGIHTCAQPACSYSCSVANVLSNIFIDMINIERHGVEIHKCPRRSTQKA